MAMYGNSSFATMLSISGSSSPAEYHLYKIANKIISPFNNEALKVSIETVH
jgi:hypothetical protein